MLYSRGHKCELLKLAMCREVALLDNTIRSLENQGDSLTMIAPEGISKRHWWWWLS